MLRCPDLEFIREKVPIIEVASQLGLVVVGYRARCWRTESHRNGDANPSLNFYKKTNKFMCFVCDAHTASTIDLVMRVRGSGLREAVSWITKRFDVPPLPKGSHVKQRESWFPRFRSGDTRDVIELLVRSGLWATLSHAERTILPVLSTFLNRDVEPVAVSYRGLRRYSGVGSDATIAAAVRHFEKMGFLQVVRSRSEKTLRCTNQYSFAFDSPVFQALVKRVFQQQQAEIELEKALRAEERKIKANSVHMYR